MKTDFRESEQTVLVVDDDANVVQLTRLYLEVWPESHWPGFALREADVFKTYMAWWCM